MNRIEAKFAQAKEAGQKAFIPFITAGDPDLPTTGELILEFERRGASIIELGIPYSDPIADGPVIQASYTRALKREIPVREILEFIAHLREKTQIPLISMVSYSIVHKCGMEEYLGRAKEAGLDGLIVPDLPVDEARELSSAAETYSLKTILLCAPSTPPQRRRHIAEVSTGFIYYISVMGITGPRERLPEDVQEHLRELKSLTDKPVCIGFGVSRAEQVRMLARVADGIIVGSAIVNLIAENAERPREEIVSITGEFIADLMTGLK